MMGIMEIIMEVIMEEFVWLMTMLLLYLDVEIISD